MELQVSNVYEWMGGLVFLMFMVLFSRIPDGTRQMLDFGSIKSSIICFFTAMLVSRWGKVEKSELNIPLSNSVLGCYDDICS